MDRALRSVGLAAALAAGAVAQSPAAPPSPSPPLRDVTEATRADPDRLAALQRPGRVLFEDDFESDASGARWFEIRGADDGRATRIVDADCVHRGEGAMRFVAPDRDGEESGAGASGWLGADGHDRIHLRYYIRFAADYDQGDLNHTGGGLAAISGNGRWDEMGKAGIRPDGTDRFTIGFEPWRDWRRQPSPGYLFVYAYWMDMARDRDGNYWGNMLAPPPERRVVPPRGEWICLEQMLQANSVSDDGPQADGELATWIDGRLYQHFENIRWRADERVRIKRFHIGIYVHRARQDNEVLFDDVVVSTGYVGPVAGR